MAWVLCSSCLRFCFLGLGKQMPLQIELRALESEEAAKVGFQLTGLFVENIKSRFVPFP
jgi:hypothetical protein